MKKPMHQCTIANLRNKIKKKPQNKKKTLFFLCFRNYTNMLPILQAQYPWLEQDLASVNRTETPWVIVFGHRSFVL